MQTKIKCYAGCPRISVSRGSSSDGRRYRSWKAQAPSSSKNAYPFLELKNASAFLISQSDMQCFSHEDGCLAPFRNTTLAVWTAALGWRLNESHRINSISNKFLISRQYCCLWSWQVSLGLRQRQQNPASEACLLPLILVSFIGSTAVAAYSCFWDNIAAFDLGRFHWVFGRGNKFLLLGHYCCLWPWQVSSGLRQRQQIPASETILLPLVPAGSHNTPV